MKLLYSYDHSWGGNPAPDYDIYTAVDRVCGSSPYDDRGTLERLEDRVQQSADLMGRLMHMLHQKGLLSDPEVCEVLGHGWSVENAGE